MELTLLNSERVDLLLFVAAITLAALVTCGRPDSFVWNCKIPNGLLIVMPASQMQFWVMYWCEFWVTVIVPFRCWSEAEIKNGALRRVFLHIYYSSRTVLSLTGRLIEYCSEFFFWVKKNMLLCIQYTSRFHPAARECSNSTSPWTPTPAAVSAGATADMSPLRCSVGPAPVHYQEKRMLAIIFDYCYGK
jgi:hypothetical protein